MIWSCFAKNNIKKEQTKDLGGPSKSLDLNLTEMPCSELT